MTYYDTPEQIRYQLRPFRCSVRKCKQEAILSAPHELGGRYYFCKDHVYIREGYLHALETGEWSIANHAKESEP